MSEIVQRRIGLVLLFLLFQAASIAGSFVMPMEVAATLSLFTGMIVGAILVVMWE